MNLCDNLARTAPQLSLPIFTKTHKTTITKEPHSPIRSVTPAESAQLQKELEYCFKMTNLVTIPLGNDNFHHLKNNSIKYTMLSANRLKNEYDSTSPGNHEVFSPDALVEALKVLSDYIPENVRNQLKGVGVELSLIAKKALNIPDYNKSIKNCNYVLNLFENDADFPQTTTLTFEEQTKNVIDKTAVSKKIYEFERNGGNKNNPPPIIEKFYQYRLANDLKAVNSHLLSTTLADIGINGIRIAGNSAYISFNSKIQNILKISVKAGTLALEFYDKVKKTELFKTDDPKYNDLTPRERFSLEKIRLRRDELVSKNTTIITGMLKWIKTDTLEHFSQNSVVCALLKGFRADPDEVLIKMNKNENVKDYIFKKMMDLYKV